MLQNCLILSRLLPLFVYAVLSRKVVYCVLAVVSGPQVYIIFRLLPNVHTDSPTYQYVRHFQPLANLKNGSGICLPLASALMECEYWIMGNPDTNVAIQSSESRLAGYYSFAGTDFVQWD